MPTYGIGLVIDAGDTSAADLDVQPVVNDVLNGQTLDINLAAVISRARIKVHNPSVRPSLTHHPLVPNVSVTVPTPVLAGGRPTLPKVIGRAASSASVRTGLGHLRALADPDPVWNGSAFEPPPPAAPQGSHFVRWTVRDLPDPAQAPGGDYPLGDLDSADGSNVSLPYGGGVTQWSSSAGSDYSIAWRSAYPFKPLVSTHIVQRDDGPVIANRAVLFRARSVAHMWADFGLMLNQPFTLMVVATVLDAFAPNYATFMLDAGAATTDKVTTAQRLTWMSGGVDDDVPIYEPEGYRTAMHVAKTQMICFNDDTASKNVARVPHELTRQPKVYWGQFNGPSSLFGIYSAATRHTRAVRLANHGTQRLMLLGRSNGVLSPTFASTMAVYEIRAWDTALTRDQVDAHCAQLASTWHFEDYRRTRRTGVH